MNDLVTRLLALAEKAVDEALQFEYGDPDNRYIYRELQELRQLVQQPQDGPTDEELNDLCADHGFVFDDNHGEGFGILSNIVEAVLVRWGRHAIKPVPVSERLPEPEDCDSQGRCWWFDSSRVECWWYLEPGNRSPYETHWLPYHALPLPTK